MKLKNIRKSCLEILLGGTCILFGENLREEEIYFIPGVVIEAYGIFNIIKAGEEIFKKYLRKID